jgi:glyoxylase-like metal-dependent hydrolase (beta-lactamase superfamily II)
VGPPSQLLDALEDAGYQPSDVRWLINTHLHFDHAGGNTWREPARVGEAEGALRPTCPNATYVVQRGDLEFARKTSERTRARSRAPSFGPGADAGEV